MSKLNVQERDIVVPGEILAEGMDYLPSGDVFRDGDKLISEKVGLVNISGRIIKVIALNGKYLPKRGDLVIGKVVDIGLFGWRVDFGWAYEANISLRDVSEYINTERDNELTKYYNIGDYVVAQVVNVTSQKLIDISMKGPGLHRLKGGRIIEVSPHKVPRIIGKQGSMVSMLKQASGCRITVGQNGLVWIQGEPDKELLVENTIRKIEKESHLSGLTENIKIFLEKESGVKITDAVKLGGSHGL